MVDLFVRVHRMFILVARIRERLHSAYLVEYKGQHEQGQKETETANGESNDAEDAAFVLAVVTVFAFSGFVRGFDVDDESIVDRRDSFLDFHGVHVDKVKLLSGLGARHDILGSFGPGHRPRAPSAGNRRGLGRVGERDGLRGRSLAAGKDVVKIFGDEIIFIVRTKEHEFVLVAADPERILVRAFGESGVDVGGIVVVGQLAVFAYHEDLDGVAVGRAHDDELAIGRAVGVSGAEFGPVVCAHDGLCDGVELDEADGIRGTPVASDTTVAKARGAVDARKVCRVFWPK
mmetsp:Transcript_10710/g.27265  ORF Transcript_10710/g.27265 Transcript_10710/m.27265 type:complete len:289 (-) Transcript_10710:919-1785(-)